MTNEDDAVLVLCMLADRAPSQPATREKCHDCKLDVWVSPATKLAVAEKCPGRPFRYVCHVCLAKSQRIMQVHPLTATQIDEMRRSRIERN